MTQYHIDTDMGVDDGLALFVANRILGNSLRAISTVFGNVPVRVATRNALIFRRLIHRQVDFSIYYGAESARDGFFRDARHIHGEDGLGSATSVLGGQFLDEIEHDPNVAPLDAADSLNPDNQPTVIIGLGPATNIPSLVEKYGQPNVERIVLMSGVFFDRGNITSVAEFNAHCDPFALTETLTLGVPVTIVPLDVCRKIQLSLTTLAAYLARSPSKLMELIVRSHMTYIDFYRKSEGIDGCFPHDALAVFVAKMTNWFLRTPGRIKVELSNDARGKTSLAIDTSSHIDVVFGGELKNVREWFQAFGDPV